MLKREYRPDTPVPLFAYLRRPRLDLYLSSRALLLISENLFPGCATALRPNCFMVYKQVYAECFFYIRILYSFSRLILHARHINNLYL